MVGKRKFNSKGGKIMDEVNKLVDDLVLRGHQLTPEEKEEKFKRLKRLLNGEQTKEYQNAGDVFDEFEIK